MTAFVPSLAVFTAHALSWLDYLMLVLYFALNLGIGVWSSRRRKMTSKSFFLGNGQVAWWAAAISYFATGVSSISFMGIPAKTFAGDWMTFGSGPAQTLGGMCTGIFFVSILRRLNMTTVFDYLERRFDRRVRLFGASLAVLLKVGGRMSIIMLLPALALATVTGLNVYVSILVMGTVTTVYAMEGGFEAVVWTDVLQATVMVGSALLALFYMAGHVDGGFLHMYRQAQAANKFHLLSTAPNVSEPTLWVYLGMFLATIFVQVCDQPLMQRMFATKNEREARLTVLVGNGLVLVAGTVFFLVGTALWAFYQSHPDRLLETVPGDKIFPYFIVNELPAGLVGVIIAGLCAAAMGALSSALNATAAIIVTDFYVPRTTDKDFRIRLARWSTLVGGMLATGMAAFLAWRNVLSLWDEFLRLAALLGGSFPGVFALGLLTRRANAPGVLTGALASIAITGWVQYDTHTSVFFQGFIAIFSCIIIGYLASFAFAARIPARNLLGLTLWDMGGTGISPAAAADPRPQAT